MVGIGTAGVVDSIENLLWVQEVGGAGPMECGLDGGFPGEDVW